MDVTSPTPGDGSGNQDDAPRSRMTVSEKERTLVEQARTIEKLEDKLADAHEKVRAIEAKLQAERLTLRQMVDSAAASENQ